MILAWLGGAWSWFTKNPVAQWIAGALLALIAWEALKRKLKEDGAKEERLNTAIRQAEVKAVVEERQAEIVEEESNHADDALAARDSTAHYPTSGSVPDEISRVIFRREGGGGGQ